MHNERHDGWLMVAVTAGVVTVWWRLLMPGTTFAGMDFLNLLYPQAHLVQRAYGAGEFPLWNSHTWGGSPLLAAMQSAALYPPMWLALCGPLPFALQAYVFVHLLLGAIGAARLCRAFAGYSLGPAVLAGCGFACGTFFLGHIEQTNSVASACWTPWILLYAVRITKSGRGLTRFAVAVALGLLAGHPQYAVLAVLAAEVFAVVRLSANIWYRPRRTICRHAIKSFAMLQVALMAGLLCASGQILPTQELSRLSERVRPYADPYSPALTWSALPARVWPGYFESAAQSTAPALPVTELGIYAGLLLVPLFACGVWHLLCRRRPRDIALVGVWALALLYALGPKGGVAPLVNRLVPFLAHSRGTARALAVETLLYAVIAGVGFRAVLAMSRCRPEASGRVRLVLIATVVIAVMADLALTARRGLDGKMVPRDFLTEGMRCAEWPRWGTRLEGRIHRFMADDSHFYLDNRPAAVVRRLVRMQPNINMIERVNVLDGYEEALLPVRSYANLLRQYNRNLRFETLDAPLLALMRANTVFTEYPVDKMGPVWRYEASQSDGDRQYTVLRSAFPVPHVVDEQVLGECAGTSESIEALGVVSHLSRGDSEPYFEPMGREWRIHPFSGLQPGGLAAAADAAGITVTSLGHTRLDLRIEPRREPRRLLWLQPPYPGWRLEMMRERGRTVSVPLSAAGPLAMRFEMLAADEPVPATLIFRPFSFRLGMFVSMLAMCALLLWEAARRTRLRAVHLACESKPARPDIA